MMMIEREDSHMMHHLAVAVRALDPPGGGAERSLSSLLSGISTCLLYTSDAADE